MIKVGILAFFDDNFGDMLLRTCFTQLLRVALENLSVEDVSIEALSLTELGDDLPDDFDLICIPGGEMFGRSPQYFAEPIERLVNIAEKREIPVVISSVGMSVNEENADVLRRIMKKPCISAFSVREKADLFREYAEGSDCEISAVSDPALWIGAVYAKEAVRRKSDRPVIGINVVRGGLFTAYNGTWKLEDEEAYLEALYSALEEQGLDCRFFTNGQTLDSNALLHFTDACHIPAQKIICPDTSRELVRTVAGFDAVAAVRMHASITAYALGVPSVNLVWNNKIRDFYTSIGCPERLVEPDENAAQTAAALLQEALSQEAPAPDPALMMTLYAFLFRSLSKALNVNADGMYDFGQVCQRLRETTVPKEEDERDLRIKVRRSERRYATLFASDTSCKAQNKQLKSEKRQIKESLAASKQDLKQVKAELKQAKADLKQSKADLKQLKTDLKAAKTALGQSEKQQKKMQAELDYLNSRPIVKLYRKLAEKGQKLKK